MKARWFVVLRLFLFLLLSLPLLAESELRFCIASDPKTFNPLLVEDDSSETIRYLTGGVLLRVNRLTQEAEPELATSWKVTGGGKTISFQLRNGIRFSDGTAFSADDVAYTVEQLMAPSLHSPTGDSFRSGEGKVVTSVPAPDRITITFPAPIAGLEKLFDQVAIMSQKSPNKEMAVLGPYYVADHRAGSQVLLKRNPNYWKRDSSGRSLPYMDSIRLYVQSNRDLEMLRLRRGEIDFINSLDPEYFDKLKSESPAMAYDAGPSLDSEQMWFNQVPSSPLADYKKAWFHSAHFRRAISEAINREDLVRIAFHGHAHAAVGPISPANKFWFNSSLRPHPFDQKSALQRLAEDGFRFENGTLYDGAGHRVEFSVITNAGNKYRELMATLIQQDLAEIGVKLNVITLDFPSLIERIVRTFDYEACLLGLVNNDLDPNSQMNVWLSSAENHQWNPRQKAPETKWEAEIDELMRAQASAMDANKRKQYFDKVQEIVWQQEPFLYLVNRDSLSAVSPSVRNAHPVALTPQVYWNVDRLSRAPEMAARK